MRQSFGDWKAERFVAGQVVRNFVDLRSNRLESLSGGRDGEYSIRINFQWCICFCWDDAGPYDVEIVDFYR